MTLHIPHHCAGSQFFPTLPYKLRICLWENDASWM